jgi:hypothetical protein
MDLVHHAMEVNSLFRLDREALEKQVHEKGLAATYATPQVHSAYCRLTFSAVESEQGPHPASPSVTFSHARLQVLELTDDFQLRRILDMAFAAQTVLIGIAYIQSTFNPVFALT